ncbi:protein EPIDERMAL PATTERNING FACTOR 2-like [Olea europaea var. sylvestris]|uniref:protein EPIDERMAL PATTERNING FACTOR 2-like n=1 Tax=Olea europaea var. sylvestris TaxID=158386 RepID=UPI000C1CF19F|nr:protein EPIDERMAL PATTERNING FACTOR 2-like [Olea europaea var. sylvestris]
MKKTVSIALFLMILATGHTLRPYHFARQSKDPFKGDQSHMSTREEAKGDGLGMELYPTGSSLPDCSHACGPCVPCKRVIVSFKCSTESCPVVYKCMCKGKYYHVPSN